MLAGVQGDGPIANCAETTGSLHHLIGGDLEPWLAARIERHLARCIECTDHLEEARHSQSVWLAWQAPDPSETFADQLIRRLEQETRAARRRRQLLEWAFRPIHVPRAAAALVLMSVTLLAFGLWQSRGRPTALPSVMQSGAADPARQPSIPIAPANFEPGLRSDPTGSFSDDVRPTRDGSYRAAQRGKRAESAGTAPDRGE